jgi:hypothetical protein|tara:strand:+ start:1248 stop:2012 length:765 start_codon:yes stop_codon:yes gene_type:complete
VARGNQSGDELVRERPAWIIPLLVLAGVLIFSGAFLYYYFGPTPGEILGMDPRASAAEENIEVIVGNTRFMVPEHYTRYPNQRTGGRQPMLDMHALLPDLAPWSPERQAEFDDNSVRANVVYFSLKEAATPLNSARRLKTIYSKYLAEGEPQAGPDGLQLFAFNDESGYAGQDLFVGKDAEDRMTLIICDRRSALVESPNCMRSLLIGPNLELGYRYKRSHLDDWREIDKAILSLVQGFETLEPMDDLQGPILD